MNKGVLILIVCVIGMKCQSDGNPWGWDRLRRCDNEDYYPACGLCEGVGGEVWSDAKEDIKIADCRPVALAKDLPIEVQQDYPQLDKMFTQNQHYEIMITDKTNMLCIGGFPGPDSTKQHCYQRQTGQFIYDWNNYRLKMVLDVYGRLFNQTSTITHVKGNMWISNNFEVTKQCICTAPGASIGYDIYPLQYDFMKEDSRFIGREELWIEFVEEYMLVDHWTKGPHHIWKDVNTNKIVRMWQPWNGLEVWHPSAWDFQDNSQQFQVPPQECINGWFRIKCDDNGYPITTNKFI